MSEFLGSIEYDVVARRDGTLVSERVQLDTDGTYKPNIPEDREIILRTEKKNKPRPQVKGQISIDDVFNDKAIKKKQQELVEEFGDILTERDKNPNEETKDNVMAIACRRNKRKSRFDRQLDAFYAK